MAHIFWQVDNPGPPNSNHSYVVNYGWHSLDGWKVVRKPMERPDALLIITVRGAPRSRHGDTVYKARRGSITLYLVGEEQEYWCDDTWESYWFHFIPSPAMLEILAGYGITSGRVWPDAASEQLIDQLSEMFAYDRLPKPLAFYRASVFADRILLNCLQDSPELRQKPRRSRLADIGEYMQLNPLATQSVEKLARMAYLSPSRFAHVFKQEFGVSVRQYLQHACMQKAMLLLKTTALSAAEIGYELGYTSPYAFYAAFKKAARMTPKEYRKANGGRGRARTD